MPIISTKLLNYFEKDFLIQSSADTASGHGWGHPHIRIKSKYEHINTPNNEGFISYVSLAYISFLHYWLIQFQQDLLL